MPDDSISARVIGADDVINAFRELQQDLPRSTVPAALRRAARWLTSQIQLAAPIGGLRSRDQHPGLLEASIVTASRRRSAGVGVRNQAFYWWFLERGWTNRSGNHFQYPFATPVVKANFNTVLRIVIEEVDRKIERYNRRGAK